MSRSGLHPGDALSAYDYLWRLSPDRWAWEFLRRNGEFRRDAALRRDGEVSARRAPCLDAAILRPRMAQTLAERWGLVLMPDPDKNGFDADAVWNRAAFPDQIEIYASARAPNETCEFWDRTAAVCSFTHVTDTTGREFLLIRRNGCVVQLRCTGLSMLGLEPLRLKLIIPDVEGYERRVRLQRTAFEIYGEQPALSKPAWTKTTEVLRNCLVALDRLDQGASRRDIAVALYGDRRVREEWNGPSMKHSVRYLVNKAEALRDGGYLKELLHARTSIAGA